MTGRPGLDAWLEGADRLLDEDCYGRSWEADAMTVCHGPDGDPIEEPETRTQWITTTLRDFYRSCGFSAGEAERQAARTEVRAAELAAALTRLGDAMVVSGHQITEWWVMVREAVGLTGSTGARPAHEPTRPALTVRRRVCPTHGAELTAGQCRLCQRQAVRRENRH